VSPLEAQDIYDSEKSEDARKKFVRKKRK
jgi:hypothetical protein